MENDSPTGEAKQRLDVETNFIRREQGQSRVEKKRSHPSRETTEEMKEGEQNQKTTEEQDIRMTTHLQPGELGMLSAYSSHEQTSKEKAQDRHRSWLSPKDPLWQSMAQQLLEPGTVPATLIAFRDLFCSEPNCFANPSVLLASVLPGSSELHSLRVCRGKARGRKGWSKAAEEWGRAERILLGRDPLHEPAQPLALLKWQIKVTSLWCTPKLSCQVLGGYKTLAAHLNGLPQAYHCQK